MILIVGHTHIYIHRYKDLTSSYFCNRSELLNVKPVCKNCSHLHNENIQQLLNPFSYPQYSISHVRVYRVDISIGELAIHGRA